ncbi:hypothetical protein Bbelb_242560 [Branchiostoma belcheri]|nr:hypothetical protein Bbelb_242560 [Branchiostoma belcheri]
MGSLITRFGGETETDVTASHSSSVPGMSIGGQVKKDNFLRRKPGIEPPKDDHSRGSDQTVINQNPCINQKCSYCLPHPQLPVKRITRIPKKFVLDLHGNTRCVDVQQETTVADLTIQLEAEKILPPGGSLMAGSKKLKKTQLMSEVPSNIEVVLALRGGAPAGKRNSLNSRTGLKVKKASTLQFLVKYCLCKNESVPNGETPTGRRPCPSLAGNGVLTVPTQLAASTNFPRTAVPEISDGTPSLPARPEPSGMETGVY